MFDKLVQLKKEHRKPYHDSRAFDRHCRNHGWCPYCRDNRLYCSKKRIEKTEFDLNNLNDHIEVDE